MGRGSRSLEEGQEPLFISVCGPAPFSERHSGNTRCYVPQIEMTRSRPRNSPSLCIPHGPNRGSIPRLVHRHRPRPSVFQPNLPLSCVAAHLNGAGAHVVK